MKEKKIKKAARTIIFDESNKKIAILEVKNWDFYKIPGGGVEENESIEETAIREAFEESSCDVKLITKLSESEFESPDCPNLFYHSVCFLAKKLKDHETSNFDKREIENNYKLIWQSFDEAIKLFENIKSQSQFELAMNNRDLNFIKIGKEYLSNNGYSNSF